MLSSPIELSVILPAFNEQFDIRQNVRRVDQKLFALGVPYEIIIVNDGSEDRTLEFSLECKGPRIQVLSYERNVGKGFAVKQGMMHAQGQYRLFMDVDLSTSLDAIEVFYERMRLGQDDILIGDRTSAPKNHPDRRTFIRRLLSFMFIKCSCLCVGRRLNDFTCGFKMFNQRAVHILFPRQRTHQWTFDTELIAIAVLHGLKIGEIPVVWSPPAKSSTRTSEDMFTSLGELIQIRWNAWRGSYGPS